MCDQYLTEQNDRTDNNCCATVLLILGFHDDPVPFITPCYGKQVSINYISNYKVNDENVANCAMDKCLGFTEKGVLTIPGLVPPSPQQVHVPDKTWLMIKIHNIMDYVYTYVLAPKVDILQEFSY